MAVRRYEDELKFLEQISPVEWRIKKGFVPGMNVDGSFYLDSSLFELQMEELQQHSKAGGVGGFLPAVKQIANVAALPGIVRRSVAMPDCHSGYGFAIGNVAAFDMDDPTAVVSPGGVGFDINCGVRAIRTNLTEADVRPHLEQLTQSLFDHIPVGVGSKGVIPTSGSDLEAALELGIDWSLREGYAWAEDKEHCFAPETRVLMADGSARAIGECAVGDRLVDETGAARTIVRSSRGKGQLYEVAYGSHADARFVCNGGHQLVVVVSSTATVAPAADASAAQFDVSHIALAQDSSLGFIAPVQHSASFADRAAAEAFAAKQAGAAATSPLLWEPTVSQYRAFAAAYPSRVAWCSMARVAVSSFPDAQARAAHANTLPQLQSQSSQAQQPCSDAAARVEPQPPAADGGKQGDAKPCSSTSDAAVPRGWQLCSFSIAPAGSGAYVSVEVDGPTHRFLLADHLLVHNCEEYGRLLMADPCKVSKRAKKRGLPQLGTLGAGNHYAEVQVVDEIYDKFAASRMGIEEAGQVMIMIHSGSRGLGHQVATDALVEMEAAMARDGIKVNDRQLACARISSPEGQAYLSGMAAAANYAFVNRASMTFLVRQAFAKTFKHLADSPDDLDMALVYDVSHNIAKVEEHFVDGRPRKLLVHRKGATRAFGPHHPLLPVDYQFTGQPVIIGGTMGTCSYILTGTDKGMAETFGSTCHGAGRASSRAKSRRTLTYEGVLEDLAAKGISIRVASPKLVMEEAPESYKDVCAVVDTCHEAGISNKVVKLRPIAVVKG